MHARVLQVAVNVYSSGKKHLVQKQRAQFTITVYTGVYTVIDGCTVGEFLKFHIT